MIINKLTKLIEKSQEHIEDELRNYIGASSIGSDCLRQIWYQFKGVEAESVPARFRRTWAIGKRLEGLVIEWLEDAGVTVSRSNKTYHAINVPIFQGHFDGIIRIGKKDASFKLFRKNGLKVWNPQYYAQVQSYMGMSGIFSTYILVLNKDNSDLYDELVLFDEMFYQALVAKALMISLAVIEPPRIHGSPLYFKCKMCKYNKVCHK
jgi:hypothetical protein